MKIDLARRSKIYNDSGPYINFPEESLYKLSDGLTTISGITVSGGSTLAVICDLQSRYLIDNIVYYRNQNNSETVNIQGKQNEADPWITLQKSSNSTTVSGSLTNQENKYRFIRVLHTVGTGTSSVYELEINSSDVGLTFVSDASGTVSIDTGTEPLEFTAIPITNNDDEDQTFYVLADPEEPNSNLISISNSSSGPFYTIYQNKISVPSTYPFSSGSFTNTSVVSSAVETSSTTGVYYTPVLDINSLSGRRIFWRAENFPPSEIDLASSVDNFPTIGIRMSNTAPSDPGWASGTISNDSLWSVVSGTLPYVSVVNNTILDYNSRRYFQAKIEFHKQTTSPRLLEIGVEAGVSLSIPSHEARDIYVKSISTTYQSNRITGILSWFFKSRG